MMYQAQEKVFSGNLNVPKYLIKLSKVASSESFSPEIYQLSDEGKSEFIKLSECDIKKVFNQIH